MYGLDIKSPVANATLGSLKANLVTMEKYLKQTLELQNESDKLVAKERDRIISISAYMAKLVHKKMTKVRSLHSSREYMIN